MADSLNPVANIYQGFWTNWSEGSTWGLTLTLCSTHATILTNSLAMFVTVTGLQLWTVIRFAVYQFGPSVKPELATPHLNQQQRVLRNAGSALSTARFMLKIAWTSRRASGRISLRAYSIGILASLYAVLFGLAVIFSNKAVASSSINGGSPVLLRNSNCGLWNQTYLDIVEANGGFASQYDFALFAQNSANTAEDVQLSLEYAQECYLSQSSSKSADGMSSTCHTLKQSKLTWTTSNSSCPFDSKVCHADSTAILLETGVYDSYQHFGLNAKSQDRLSYQRKTVCAVLDSTDYIEGWDGTVINASSTRPTAQVARVYYGANIIHGTNYTYSLSNFASFYDNFTDEISYPYGLAVQRAYGVVQGGLSNSDFEPIPELQLADADVVLFFLNFEGMYLGPVSDPWFSAHQRNSFDNPSAVLETRYARDTAISTIGCTEQHQFCTSNQTCTGFLGFDQVQALPAFLNALSQKQNTTFNRMVETLSVAGMGDIIEGLQLTTTPLLASTLIDGGASGAIISPQLPPSQWTDELHYWHSITMAHIQRVIVQWATGQIAASPQYLIPASEPDDVWFCNNMVVPSATYQSFRAVAIILILVFGSLIIVGSLFMQKLAMLLRKCLKRSNPSWQWDDDDWLGLPRYARKSLGKPPTPPKDNPPCRKLSNDKSCGNIARGAEPKSNLHRQSSQVLPSHGRSILPQGGPKSPNSYISSRHPLTSYQTQSTSDFTEKDLMVNEMQCKSSRKLFDGYSNGVRKSQVFFLPEPLPTASTRTLYRYPDRSLRGQLAPEWI